MTDDITELVRKARTAQEIIEFWPQERVDGMGVYDDKVLKHQKKPLGTSRDLHGLKPTGVIEEDPARGLLKIAKPAGVIGVLSPVTNASSTLAVNGLPILKTRNAVIFAPHPKAKATANLTCDFMRTGLAQVGAPLDLVQNLTDPTVELTQQLMKQVDLVVATGGSAMVKVAYSSGTPAYGVGAGNSVVVVDETADLNDAANKIRLGKIFDNATSCSSENSVVMHDSIFDAMVERFEEYGGYVVNGDHKLRLRAGMWPDGEHLSRDVVGQPAAKIAALAGIPAPAGTPLLMGHGAGGGP